MKRKSIITKNKSLYKRCNRGIVFSICTLVLYVVGALLFLCSVEVIVLKSMQGRQFYWNNLDLIWIFGLLIFFIGVICHIILLNETLHFQQKVKTSTLFKIKYFNKYLKKWQQISYSKKRLFWFFFSLFNTEIFYSSIKKNIEAKQVEKTVNASEEKLRTIIEEYYDQMQKNK